MKLEVLMPNHMDFVLMRRRPGQTECGNCHHEKCPENTIATRTVLINLIEHFLGPSYPWH